jgi:hypothetical protein
MQRYLATLHKRSDTYKKRFAFITASTFTASMFMVWSLVNFGLPAHSSAKLATAEANRETVAVKVSTDAEPKSPSPFANFKEGIAGAVVAAKPYLENTKDYVVELDFENSYNEMRNSVFEKYGR